MSTNETEAVGGSIRNCLKYYMEDAWNEYGYPYEELPFLRSGPWPTLSLTLIYLIFITHIGPQIMKDRKPVQLQKFLLSHNLLLALFNAINSILFIWATNFGMTTLDCDLILWKEAYGKKLYRIVMLYLFYMSKFVDFVDTIVMVLKKKPVKGLHLFHHSVMPISLYLIYKLSPYENLILMAGLNSFVHIFMYSYYGLSALGPEYQKYLWWKKHITQLQLTQFAIMIIHAFYFLLFQRSCPTSVILINFSYGLVFLPLFLSFYKASYRKKQVKND